MGRTPEDKDLQFCLYVNCRNRIVADQFNFIREHASHLQPDNFLTFLEAKIKIDKMNNDGQIVSPTTLMERLLKASS